MKFANNGKSEQKKQPEQSPKKNTEKLSNQDIKELMGMSRPTYKRHKGAMRQK
jgi:hypothetical protein